MGAIENLNPYISYVFMGGFYTVMGVILLSIAYAKIITPVENLIRRTGIEFKWMREKRKKNELLMDTAKKLRELEEQRKIDVEQSVRHDEMIRKDLSELKTMFIDMNIDTMRWEIINFAQKITDGKTCNKDSYKHCLRTYEKYEKLLEDNELTNGEVDISMHVVKESYMEKLKNGF